MKAVYKKRLQKLADFLETIPSKHFNLDYIAMDNDGCNLENYSKKMKQIGKGEKVKCGAVGCAIGWMPIVFRDFKYDGKGEFKIINVKTESTNQRAASQFFGLDQKQCGYLFLPDNYKKGYKHHVVARIRKFIEEDGGLHHELCPNNMIYDWR